MNHEHQWEQVKVETSSVAVIYRYKCTVEGCNQYGWRTKKERILGGPVKIYKHPPQDLQAEITAAPRSAGTNKRGGYLPPGSH